MYSLNPIYVYIYIYMLSSFSQISQQTEENRKQIGEVVIYRVTEFYYYCIRIPIHDLHLIILAETGRFLTS